MTPAFQVMFVLNISQGSIAMAKTRSVRIEQTKLSVRELIVKMWKQGVSMKNISTDLQLTRKRVQYTTKK